MQKIKQYISSRKYVLIIVVLFFLIRLPFLDSTFLLYDERDTVLTQYSLAKTGKDLYGNQTPLTFSRISPQAPVLAMYYGVPFWFLGLPKTVAMARFIYLLPATILPLLVFELIYAITKQKKISLLTSIIFSFSPWVYHISRLALEINIAFPMFLGAILTQLKKKTTLSLFLYFITYFTYQGIRPLIPVIFVYFELWNVICDKKYIHSIIKSVIFCIFFVFLILLSAKIEGNIKERGSSEVLFFATERLTKEVNFNRTITKAPAIISNIIDNKIVLGFDYVIDKLFQGLNLSYLFKSGDYELKYSNTITGQFFSFMVIPFFIGLLYLGKRFHKENFLLAGLSLVGITSSLINVYSTSFSIRSLMSGVGLAFLIAIGLIYLFSLINKQKKIIQYIFYIAGCSIIIYQIGTFSLKYFLHRTTWQSELYNESERKLSLILIKTHTPITIKLSNPFSYFLSYSFYHANSTSDIGSMQHELKNNSNIYTYAGKNFQKCDINSIHFQKLPEEGIYDELCLSDKTKKYLNSIQQHYQIITYSDINPFRSGNGIKFYIFNQI